MAIYNFKVKATYDTPEAFAKDENFQSIVTTHVYFDEDMDSDIHISAKEESYYYDEEGNRVLEHVNHYNTDILADEFWELNIESYKENFIIFHNYVVGILMEAHYNYMDIKLVEDRSMLNITVKRPMEYEYDTRKIHELAYNPLPLCSGVYKGYEFEILSYGTHPCAYIRIPKDHKLYQAALNCRYTDELLLNCHGGVSFTGYLHPKRNDNWWVGWDYSHLGDYTSHCLSYTDKKWTTEEILDEVRIVIDEIVSRY